MVDSLLIMPDRDKKTDFELFGPKNVCYLLIQEYFPFKFFKIKYFKSYFQLKSSLSQKFRPSVEMVAPYRQPYWYGLTLSIKIIKTHRRTLSKNPWKHNNFSSLLWWIPNKLWPSYPPVGLFSRIIKKFRPYYHP